MRCTRKAAALLLVLLSGAGGPLEAAAVSNSASGSIGGQPLDPAAASVTLDRVGGVASAATAEISPNGVLTGSAAAAFVYDLRPTIGPSDLGVTRVEIAVPAGYTGVLVTSVAVGGAALLPFCPAPGGGQYCATAAPNLSTVVLGDRVGVSLTPIRIGFSASTPATPGSADFTSVVADGGSTLAAAAGDADGDPADANSISVAVRQTQGDVLRLDKRANKRDAYMGEVVTYTIAIRNTSATDVVQVRIEDTIPPNFKYVRGSARLDGGPLADPGGVRPLVFDVGTVPALVDANGNGRTDPGEPGFKSLVYQLVIGSGARPGGYTNTAVAEDLCAGCEISNRASASVEVRIDRDFELGTIIGKVFEDHDRDGWQDPGERGVSQAMVALDDGTYALTDEHGRYHFPGVRPGQRLVKLNRNSLPAGTVVVSDESQVLSLTPGLMVRANFGVVVRQETEVIGTAGAAGVELSPSDSVGSGKANRGITLSDRDADGRRLAAGESVPRLSVTLPPRDTRLASTRLTLAGTTEPGNRVEINGVAVTVGPDGRFAETVELPRGKSRLVIRVVDPAGHAGSIERDVEVSKHELFLLAFADGKLSQLSGRGNLEGAGLDEADELFVEGRLAFYLRGTIAGKYLITAAFDSGSGESEALFGDLDEEEQRRLLTHLDPDRFYPVYGDSSTVVYDVESQGKFYLALDSETIHLVVGNYPLSLSDNELAGYRRTLYGGHFTYRSAARTAFGDPDTEVVLFGADVRQAHIHDELRTTGGSLYYLSRRDVVEGSEEVTLTVRDENSGLLLSRERQQRDVDYTIKYEEGRLMFHRPLASVVQGGTLVAPQPLAGHSVFVEVDYEIHLDDFEKSAGGARVRRQLGERVAVGGTYIEDELEGGAYELGAGDTELRIGQHSRVSAELAESEGADARVFTSDDGGLTYQTAVASGSREGSAWKIAADLDLGEWFSRPERYRVKLYAKELEPGFSSGGNSQEQGTRKSGVLGSFELGAHDVLALRHEREERSGATALLPGAVHETSLASLQWRHERRRWGIATELFGSDSEDAAGAKLQESRFGATRLWSKLTDKLRAELEHQQTLSGSDNDRTGLALLVQALPALAVELRGSDGDRGSAAQAGAVLDLGESSIYLTERLSEDPTGSRATTTILGSRTELGPSSRVYSEYQLENSPRGERAVSLLGLQRQWDPGPGFRFRLSGELADVAAGSSPTRRSALATSLSYASDERWRVTTRNELRREDGSADRTQFLTHSQLDLRLNPDFTLLGRYRYGKTLDDDLDVTEARLDERSLGLALRPTTNDRLNSLARYTRLSDLRPFGAAGELRNEREMEVFSVETLFQVNRRVEWFSKGAARIQTEGVDDLPRVESETLLAIQRLNYRLERPLELGLEYRVLEQQLADDQRRGWLGELSWRMMPRLRFGVGYNFTDFSDNEFSQNDYSVEGWFFRIQGTH